MTQTKFVFSYTETRDFEEALEVTMEVPERSINEMCEYFQRFLAAAGYIFEEGETIGSVHRSSESGYGCGGDVLTFKNDGTPFVYDFGNSYTPYTASSVIYGGESADTISFGAAQPIVIGDGAGADTISFNDHFWG